MKKITLALKTVLFSFICTGTLTLWSMDSKENKISANSAAEALLQLSETNPTEELIKVSLSDNPDKASIELLLAKGANPLKKIKGYEHNALGNIVLKKGHLKKSDKAINEILHILILHCKKENKTIHANYLYIILAKAIQHQELGFVVALFKTGLINCALFDTTQPTLLMAACLGNTPNINMVKLLLRFNCSPLDTTRGANSFDTLLSRKMMNNGNPNVLNEVVITCIDYCKEKNLIIPIGYLNNLVLVAIDKGEVEYLRLLFAKKVIDLSFFRANPLVISSLENKFNPNIITLLLEQGYMPDSCFNILINSKDTYPHTITIVNQSILAAIQYYKKHEISMPQELLFRLLQQAINKEEYTFIASLLETGINPDCHTAEGITPLSEACVIKKPNRAIIKLLLTQGANPLYEFMPLYSPLPLSPLRIIGGRKMLDDCDVTTLNEVIILFLDHCMSKNVSIPSGDLDPALTKAIKNKESELVSALLNAGANPNSSSQENGTPLKQACSAKNPSYSIIKLLIDKGGQLDTQTSKETNPLTAALEQANCTLIKILVKADGSLLNQQNVAGETPLMLAAIRGNPAVINCLLTLGADPKIVDNNGDSALSLAISHNHKNSTGAQLLLLANPDMRSVPNNAKQTPLDHAKNNKDTEDLFATPLIILAAKNNKLAMLNKCIEENNSIINVADLDGMTSLMWAAKLGYYEIVHYLLAEKADSSCRDNAGNSALFYTVSAKNSTSIFKELLKANPAMLNVTNVYGTTTYKLAIKNQSVYAVACSQFAQEEKKHSQPKKTKKKKKKKEKTQEIDTIPQECVVKTKPTQDTLTLSFIPAQETIQEEILLYQCHARCLRWHHHTFLAYKKQQYEFEDEDTAETKFKKACRYHQIPFIVINRIVQHGTQSEKLNNTYGTTDIQYSLYGQMQFEDPAENPWNPGQQYQEGTYHCTADKDGVIYHLGFKPSNNSPNIIVSFAPKHKKADTYLAYYAGKSYGVRHVLYYT